MLPRYADIIIDISHEAIDRPFQYRIPDGLREDIRLGSMVKIPFGRGNHLRTGYVIGFSDQTEYQPDRIKEISELCDRSVPVEGRLLALAAWIRENYGSTMINAIRTVMPVKKTIRQLVDQVVVLAENMDTEHLADIREQYHRKHAQAKLRLLQALEETPERYLSMDVVKQKWNISPATLKTMQQDGVITVISKERYRTAGVYDYKENFQITLNNEQQAVVDEVTGDMEQGRQKTYLLHGITGSGKTEVYVKIVKKTIEMGKQAIILIPEIALTYQTVRYFRNYFGDRVTIINSRLSDGEKYDQFMRAKNGDVDVVIGPRSALFAPFQNLGIIIIDEEHDSSYKSEANPKYNAKEVAKTLSKVEGERDDWKERAETAEKTLKGFDGIDPANIQTELAGWKKKAEDAEKEFNAKIYERDFDDALKTALENVNFSSPAAKRSVIADIKSAGLKLKDGKILGLNDLLEQMKQDEPDTFVDESQQQAQQQQARFATARIGHQQTPGSMTKKDIEAIKDPSERQAAIAQNIQLFQ